MAITITSATNPAPARPESRGEAISRVMAERAKASEAAAAPEASASNAAPEAPAAPAAAPEAKPNHEHLVEIERRERALEAARHEGELAKRELATLREKQAELKDWRKALAAGGHNIEDIVQEWLGGDSKPTEKAPERAANPAHAGLPAELVARLEKLESREQEEARGRARLEKRARIAGMIPADSDDFEVMRTMGDNGLDMFLSQLEAVESRRPEGIGPAELSLLLKEFEGNTRKNLEKEFSGLAKSKWAKQIMKQLLVSSESLNASEKQDASVSSGQQDPATPAHADHVGERRMKLAGLSNEEIKAAARAKLVAKWNHR